MPRDVADAVEIGDGGAAEFHHKPAHDGWCVPKAIWIEGLIG
jgi:hypothetical protein